MKFSSLDKLKKFKAHYPDIARFENFDLEKFKLAYSQVVVDKPCICVQFTGDLLNYVAMAMLMKMNKYGSYLFINAYELIDIYLGNKEELKCISDIDVETLIVYLGFSEFENKRQSDVLEQVFEMQRVTKKRFWLLYKGRDLENRYPGIANLFKNYQFPMINILEVKSSSPTYEEEEI